MIVKELEKLKVVSEPVETEEEALEITNKIMQELKNHHKAVGLSAPQIGIHKRVFVMLDLENGKWYPVINPVIEKKSDTMHTQFEGCLSFPGASIRTNRHLEITFTNMYENVPITLSGLEATIFQHEYDHLDGITMFDRQIKLTPVKSNSIGRNELCHCGSNKKYKKCCI